MLFELRALAEENTSPVQDAVEEVGDIIEHAGNRAGNLLTNLPVLTTRLLMSALAIFLGVIFMRVGRRLIASIVRMRGQKGMHTLQQVSTVKSLATSVFNYIMYFIIVTVVLSILGVNVTSILAVAGVGGISPAISREMLKYCEESDDAATISALPARRLLEITNSIDDGSAMARVYADEEGTPREFHVTDLAEFAGHETLFFETVSECVDYFYTNREASNLVRQKAHPLLRSVQASLDKALLKKKKLSEDLLNAENSDKYRLYGELLTANIHLIKPGDRKVTVTNYYDGEPVTIPLDEKIGAPANVFQGEDSHPRKAGSVRG